MINQIIIGVVVTLIVGIIAWLCKGLYSKLRTRADGRKIYNWLRVNTRDEPGESHATTQEIAQGNRLHNDRVLLACGAHVGILRSTNDPNQWSIWRQERQSIFEKRGILSFE